MLVPIRRARALALAITLLFLVLSQAAVHGQPTKIVSLKRPVYPAIALGARVSGEVNVKITLQENESPANLQIVGRPPMLKQAAMDRAKGSRFEIDKNNPAETYYEVNYRYVRSIALRRTAQ